MGKTWEGAGSGRSTYVGIRLVSPETGLTWYELRIAEGDAGGLVRLPGHIRLSFILLDRSESILISD